MGDNIFDDDDALDYILYEECEKESNSNGKGGGCFSVILLVMLPPLSSIPFFHIFF